MRVLLVDDDLDVLLLGKDYFCDHDVLTAASAGDALLVLTTETVDVVVSDWRMAARDGAWLLAQVHERYPSVQRALLSSAHDCGAASEIDVRVFDKIDFHPLVAWLAELSTPTRSGGGGDG